MVLWSLSSLPERPSDNHKEMPSSSDLCSFHLIYSSASKPTPTTLTSAQNPTQSAGIHLVSCSMSKPIVQLRELFQYIAGSQWTSHLSAFTTELFPSPPSTLSLPQRPLIVCLQGREHPSSSSLVWPSWPHRGALWLTLASQAASDPVWGEMQTSIPVLSTLVILWWR